MFEALNPNLTFLGLNMALKGLTQEEGEDPSATLLLKFSPNNSQIYFFKSIL